MSKAVTAVTAVKLALGAHTALAALGVRHIGHTVGRGTMAVEALAEAMPAVFSGGRVARRLQLHLVASAASSGTATSARALRVCALEGLARAEGRVGGEEAVWGEWGVASMASTLRQGESVAATVVAGLYGALREVVGCQVHDWVSEEGSGGTPVGVMEGEMLDRCRPLSLRFLDGTLPRLLVEVVIAGRVLCTVCCGGGRQRNVGRRRPSAVCQAAQAGRTGFPLSLVSQMCQWVIHLVMRFETVHHLGRRWSFDGTKMSVPVAQRWRWTTLILVAHRTLAWVQGRRLWYQRHWWRRCRT